MSEIQKHLSEVEGLNLKVSKLAASIADDMSVLEKQLKIAHDNLEEAVLAEAEGQLSEKDYGCGTANIESDLMKIKVVVKKKIKWDEGYIQKNIEPLIKQAGKDPEQFVKYKRSVSETDYKNFDDEMKRVFEPARTVEPSNPSITYERKV